MGIFTNRFFFTYVPVCIFDEGAFVLCILDAWTDIFGSVYAIHTYVVCTVLVFVAFYM